MVKSSSPLVIGIDFGMTYTGVAYAWNESMDVKLIQDDWPGSEGVAEKKVPSIVVYKPESEKRRKRSSRGLSSNLDATTWAFSSWGFLAQEESERNNPKHKAHTFWKLFLDEKVVKAAYGNKEPTFTQKDVAGWYEDFLHELYKHIETHFVNTRPKLWASEVQFVFSVPTTWEEDVIDRFKTCFTNAGFGPKPGHIHTARVTLTEAQAAAVCTAYEQSEEFENGELILICDAGGGTTDIALLQVDSGHGEPLKLKQMDRVYGRRAGSTQIDQDFEEYVCKQLMQLQNDHPTMVQNVGLTARSMAASRPFQVQKCTLGSKVSTIPFGVPVPGCASDFSHVDSDIENGKLIFTPKKMAALFDKRLETIFGAVDMQLQNLGNLDGHQRVSYMVLSGGLGSSQYVKKKLEQRYCEGRYSNAAGMSILRAETPQLVVAKGLVTNHLRTLGKDNVNGTSVLQNWISPRSYGVLSVKPWDPETHLPQDKETPDDLTGKAYARNQIQWVIKKVSPLYLIVGNPLLRSAGGEFDQPKCKNTPMQEKIQVGWQRLLR
jgi:molecular chaperone DnaK (HSP70)